MGVIEPDPKESQSEHKDFLLLSIDRLR